MIINTYALYKSQLEGTYNNSLGRWIIDVNGNEISSGTQIEEFDLTPEYMKYVQSEYVADGKIAPGSQGYFELLIDASKTDVSILYEITLGSATKNKTEDEPSAIAETVDDPGDENVEEDIETEDPNVTAKIELVKIENFFELSPEDTELISNTNTKIDLEKNLYKGVMPIQRIEDKYFNLIRVYYRWKNDELKNEDDVVLGEKEESQLSIPIRMVLTQYRGEKLEI